MTQVTNPGVAPASGKSETSPHILGLHGKEIRQDSQLNRENRFTSFVLTGFGLMQARDANAS